MKIKINVLTLECVSDNTTSYYNDLKNYKGDAGFDLYCCKDFVVPANARSQKIFLGVKASLHDELFDNSFMYKSFMLVPRSSMGSKTPLRLSNSIGIIDSGYRGELIAVVDNISNKDYSIKKGDRLVQIVPFDGTGVSTLLLDNVNSTERGVNGFGSTG